MPTDLIICLDLETTGVNEYDDPIIEVGAVALDMAFRTLDTFTAVCHASPEVLIDRLNDYVRKMHTRNGLLDDLAQGKGIPLADVDEAIARWIKGLNNGSSNKAAMAGSGVGHFDSRFIRAQMPLLAKALTFWTLDVGVMRRMCEFSGRRDLILDGTHDKTHRALDDAEFHARELRHYASVLQGVPTNRFGSGDDLWCMVCGHSPCRCDSAP